MDPDFVISKTPTLKSLKDRLQHYNKFGRRYNKDLANARLRGLSIIAQKPADKVEELFWGQVYDYEIVLSRYHRRPMTASYTRRAVRNSSVREFLIKLMTKPSTYGWNLLRETEHPEASYEVVLEKYPKEFPEVAVKVAVKRLKAARKRLNKRDD